MKKLQNATSLLTLLTILIAAASCNRGQNKNEPTDTPTSGTVQIAIDESYSLLFETQIYTFESLYTNANVIASYKPEREALSDLINDSCKVAVINRDLSAEEKQLFESKNIYPKSTKIAEDAIALIVHMDNQDTTISVPELIKILEGTDTTWSTEKKEKITIVFDNDKSANARYMAELLKGKPFQRNCFAVHSNPEVINYVSTHPNSLGIISVNWITDKYDTVSQNFLNKIKVLGVAKDESGALNAQYFKPFQAYIKTKDYPLTRDVYMINRQTRAGLGMGFVSFVAGEKGQRMILKSGLIPATMPVRVVQIN